MWIPRSQGTVEANINMFLIISKSWWLAITHACNAIVNIIHHMLYLHIPLMSAHEKLEPKDMSWLMVMVTGSLMVVVSLMVPVCDSSCRSLKMVPCCCAPVIISFKLQSLLLWHRYILECKRKIWVKPMQMPAAQASNIGSKYILSIVIPLRDWVRQSRHPSIHPSNFLQ